VREVLTIPPAAPGFVWQHIPHGRLHFWHHHDELEFNLVVRGTARYLLDDRRYDLGPGCLVWLFPAQEHLLVDLSDDFECWIAVIRPEVLRKVCGEGYRELLVEDAAGHFCRRLCEEDRGFLVRLCRDLREATGAQAPRLRAGLGYLYLTAWSIFSATTDLVSGVHMHPGVERAAAALARGDGDLAAIAVRAGLSASQLSRLFHRQVGQTLVAYRGRMRVQRFLELHKQKPDRSMLALALSAGFGSYAQFHRTFRSVLGVTPSAWIEQQAHQAYSASMS
jgi:AraC-like DNA-binding protein